jgi:hypothetical protein
LHGEELCIERVSGGISDLEKNVWRDAARLIGTERFESDRTCGTDRRWGDTEPVGLERLLEIGSTREYDGARLHDGRRTRARHRLEKTGGANASIVMRNGPPLLNGAEEEAAAPKRIASHA